jgi:hypothetical protein
MQLEGFSLVLLHPEHHCRRNSTAMTQLTFLIFSPPRVPNTRQASQVYIVLKARGRRELNRVVGLINQCTFDSCGCAGLGSVNRARYIIEAPLIMANIFVCRW